MANRCKICKSNSIHNSDCPRFFRVINIKCELCEHIFERKIANKKYCSEKCRRKSFADREENGLVDLNSKSDKWKSAVMLNKEQALESSYNTFCKNIQRHHGSSTINNLTFDEFCEIVILKCFYCNCKPSQSMSKLFKKNGIDRIDCLSDYSYDNCVSCCWTCNRMKSSMKVEEFISHIGNINKFNKSYIKNSHKYSLSDRIQMYNNTFVEYPKMTYDKGWMLGNWSVGNCYKGSGWHGAYPYKYLDRIKSLFPEFHKKEVLHLFSGSLSSGYSDVDFSKDFPGITFDKNPELGADIIGDAENLSEIVKKKFKIILADCPYSEVDANRYGYPMINRNKTVKECYKILKPGGFLCWMDMVLPMYSKRQFKRVGEIYISRSTNHRVRAVFIFERLKDEACDS